MALKASHRLRRKKEIETVLRVGRRRGGTAFRLFFYPNTKGHARFAFVVSGKTVRTAVSRNRLRRRVTGWLQHEPDLLNSAVDIVCIFNQKAVQLSRNELYEDFKKNFFIPSASLSGHPFPRS